MSRRRASLIALVVLAALALLALLPAMPPVRDYLVERALQALEASGTTVTYTTTEGNAWRGIALRGATITGPGIDVDVDRLRVGYFLPSLIGGELPLDIEVSGGRGRLDVSQVLSGTVAGGPAGAAPGPMTVRLRRLALDDVAVEVEELPFTLPDATLSDVQVDQSGTALDLAATITTPEGSARVAGRFETITGAFDGRVERADATLARQWWGGVTAGDVTGTLRVRGSSITGSFDLTGGAVDDIGLVATDVAGRVELDYPVITADLTGDVFGGPVAATGVVNVAAERWQARANGQAGLAEAVAWLFRGTYPDGPPVALEGTTDLTLELAGWDYVTLEGAATGSGSVQGIPLEGLAASFRLPRNGRVQAEGRALLGGGDVSLAIGPGSGGDEVVVNATGVDLAGLAEGLGTADARLRLAADGRQDGVLVVDWRAGLAGRGVEARLDARLDPDGWQGFITGQDSAGTLLEGALVLGGGRVQGGITATGEGLAPLSPGAVVGIGISGPDTLRGARVTLALNGDAPVTLGDLLPGVDLRGSAAGTLDEGLDVTGLVGQFGPLAVSGAVDMGPFAVVADLILEPTHVTLAGGEVSAELMVPASSLVYGADGLSWRGRLQHRGLTVGPVATVAGALLFEARAPDDEAAWRMTATSDNGDLRLTADPAGVSLEVDGLPVDLAGSEERPTLSVSLAGSAALPFGAEASGGVVDVTLSDAGGAAFALPSDVRLAGETEGETLALSGSVGDLPLSLLVSWSGPLQAQAVLGDGAGGRLTATIEDQVITAQGDADLGAFWRLATRQEPPLQGHATIDLTARLTDTLETIDGYATLTTTTPLPATATITGRGTTLTTHLQADIPGLPIRGDGQVDITTLTPDTPLITIDAGPLHDLTITTNGATGQGTLPTTTAGPATIPPTPWTLDATWTDTPTAHITIAGDPLTLTIQDGHLTTNAPLTIPATYAGNPLTLTIDIPNRRAPLDDLPNTPITATLTTPDTTLLHATGTITDLDITGTIPTQLLTTPLPPNTRPTSQLTLTGNANIPDQHATITINQDLTATYHQGTITLTANNANLTPHLPDQTPTGLQATTNGDLQHHPTTGWQGTLTTQLTHTTNTATITLTGQGPQLHLDLNTDTRPIQLRAGGTLAPRLEVTGAAQAFGGAVTAGLAATQEDGLTVRLASEAFSNEPYVSMPPLTATLTVPFAGEGPRLSGDWVDARVTGDGALTGGVDLPFALLGDPAVFRLDLAGTLSDPQLTASLEGTGVSASAEGGLAGATAALSVGGPAVEAALPEAASALASLLTSPVTASAVWDPATGWRVDASADGELPAAGAVGLTLALEGEGASYRGEVAASLPGAPGSDPVAVATLRGEGGDLTAVLDLAAVDLARIGAAYGLYVDVVATGRVFLGTDPMTAELDLDVAGTVDGAEVALVGEAPDDLRFSLRAPDLDVTGRLAWNEPRRVVVSGQAAGRPLEAWLEVDDAFENGRLHVDLPGLSLDASLATPEPGLRTASLAGELTGGPLGLSGELSGEVVALGGDVRLQGLRAEVEGAPGLPAGERLLVTGGGTLAPALELSGRVATAGGALADQPGTWRLGGEPLTATVAWLGLDAEYVLATGEARLQPAGDVSPAAQALVPALAGASVGLEGEGLSWRREAGFAGELRVTASGGSLPAALSMEARATAEGALDLAVRAGETGDPLLELAATLPGDAPATGALAAPLAVSGAVEAAGLLTAGPRGAALRLTGEGLELEATSGAEGWAVSGVVDALPLAGLLPLRDEPTLSLRLSGGSATGGLAVEDLVLASGASTLRGSASLDGSLRMALRAQIDLADVDAGDTRLTGLLRGPVVLVAPGLQDLGKVTVTAQLDAVGVGVEGVPALVDGALQVGGTAADPVVYASLTGRGDLRGSLRLEAAPGRARMDLRSTLAYSDLTSDVRVSVMGDAVTANGTLRAGDAVLLVSEVDGEVTLTGAGRLDGWQGVVARGLAGITVEGPLATLSPALSGSAALAVGAPAGPGAWLTGRLSDLAVAGQAVGDVTVSSEAAGAPVLVDGPGLAARLDPADLSWSLEVSGLTLPGSLDLDVEGAGRGAEGDLTARVVGGGPVGVDVALALGLTGEATTLTASGTLLGGDLKLSGRRAPGAEWTGEVALVGAEALVEEESPAVLLTARGVLQGRQLVPQVVLATAAYAEGAGVAAAGRVSAGPAGVTLDQTLALPGATGPLRVQGRVAPGLDVAVSGTGVGPGQPRGEFRLSERPDGLSGAGMVTVPLGPATAWLGAAGTSRSPRLTVTPQAVPEASFYVDLAADSVADLVARVLNEGLVVTGTGAAKGTALLTLDDGGALQLRGLGVTLSGFSATLSGALALDAADLSGTLELPLETPDPADRRLPLQVTASDGSWRLTSSGRLGDLAAEYDARTGAALVDVALALPAEEEGSGPLAGFSAGSVTARVSYAPGSEPTGTVEVSGVRLAPPGWGNVTIDADASLADGRVGGAATVAADAGSLTISGDAPLERLLGALGAGGQVTGGPGEVELRLRAVELSSIPVLASVAPHVTGALSGLVRLQGDFVFGQLVAPDLSVADTRLPLELQLSGPTSRVDAAMLLGGSLFSLTLSDLTLAGSARLERFPLDLIAEAVVGPTDVTAFFTGVARIDLPLTDPSEGYAAVASEELTLERAGVVTRGDVTLVWDDGALNVERADFSGRGDWRAGGVLGSELLDFELVAEEADFGPILGLVPGLARLGVGAEGSFTFTAAGSLARPQMAFQTEALDFEVAGTRYRLSGADLRLEGVALSAQATLSAIAPVRGDLRLAGDATVVLEPLALRAADLRFDGELVVPGVGRIEEVTGAVTQDPLFRPYLAFTGQLGAPVAVQGTLVPLDLRAGGTGLRISYPAMLIADATLSADIRLVGTDSGVTLSGAIAADEVVIDPSVAAGDEPAEPEATAEAPETSPAPEAATLEPAPPGALAGLRFDDLRIMAPQRVVMTNSFASLEAALDLTLSGTGADPRLDGEARALRGNLRFSGREFTVDSAVATFAPNRGVLPELDVRAHTEFEKSRVLAGSSDVEFVSPDGRSFRVDLAFAGPVERDDDGAIRFDVQPTLTSEALIEASDAAGNGVRPLTEAELLTLVTLGRLELGSDLIGAGGLGGAVAQGALDTAVDVFLLGELQNALREALGLDVVEIRTSAISQLLEGGAEPFGVSVRLGGYLNPELFASYRIGTADPDDAGFAVTNEVALRYALGPLDLEVSGRIDFPNAGELTAPRSELGLGLGYDFGRSLGLDLSTSLSTERSVVSFGVTLRW